MFKKLGKKAKALGVIAGATIITTSAQAAVSFDPTTKTLTGDVEMGAYYSAVPIVLGVMSATIVIALMFGMFSKAKRG